ncbi:hypothetical protein JTE90_001307 [Oedothorax gibbosus]|uniref:Uncharacterized protein n=1 Tax=Oedothorax gibbosus TaxID=931172 RepID=A0AAV6TQX8_9ARAC|nr:hypothetical protein JTE90_001307 [Oedothorax gibbosus]
MPAKHGAIRLELMSGPNRERLSKQIVNKIRHSNGQSSDFVCDRNVHVRRQNLCNLFVVHKHSFILKIGTSTS